MEVGKVQNNTTFGARLDVRSLNNPRWDNIAKQFEIATKKYPKDKITITLGETEARKPLYAGIYKKNGLIFKTKIVGKTEQVDREGQLSKVGTKILESLSDEEIVKKLVAFHKLFRDDLQLLIGGKNLIEQFQNIFAGPALYKNKFFEMLNRTRNMSLADEMISDRVWSRFHTLRDLKQFNFD